MKTSTRTGLYLAETEGGACKDGAAKRPRMAYGFEGSLSCITSTPSGGRFSDNE